MEDALRLFKSTREFLTPTLKESSFLQTGMLTPEEFVRAGDHLVRNSPSWRWESGDKANVKPYLPEAKQYLCTYGVPCFQRISALHSSAMVQESVSLEGFAGEDWCHTHFDAAKSAAEDSDIEIIDKEMLEMDISPAPANAPSAAPSTTAEETARDTHAHTQTAAAAAAAAGATAGAEEYLDMEDDSLALDSATATGATRAQTIVRVRRYDVSITYDNYYRTPKIWLSGYDDNGSPLETTAIFDDVMQDYAKRTVTIDPHPHSNKPQASVHPCRHAAAMLHIIQALQENGVTPNVDHYLFYFLKFIQSVVPTIEYDYTMDVSVGQKAN